MPGARPGTSTSTQSISGPGSSTSRATTRRPPSTGWSRRRSTVSRSRAPSTMPPPRAPATRSTSRCSAAAPSITTDGRPWCTNRSSSAPKTTARTRGSCTTWPRTRRSATASPPTRRDGCGLTCASGGGWGEGEANDVLPLDNAPFERLFGEERPAHDARKRYVYYPFAGPVTEEAAVNVRNRSHRITADVEIPAGDAQGILLAHGSILGGYVLYVRHRLLHYAHNFVGLEEHRITATAELTPGPPTLAFRFDKTGEPQGPGPP